MQPIPFEFDERQDTFTVTEVTEAIRAALTGFGSIWISGEISGAKMAPSGHWYFNLKDQESNLKCACFKMQAMRLKVKPRDGLDVVARGRLDVYGPRGEYQFIVEALRPQGEGALQLAFEQLKKRLQLEGLFDEERKRPIPRFVKRIGIVTSPSGAVIQDMIHVLERRFPGIHLRLYPAQVQGEGSANEIVRGIEYFSENPWADVVIVARGGGSLEDLWSFNEESVARAILACTVPVVSAVGHQTDFTIADFVADLRAPTPSAAAELVVPVKEDLQQSVELLRSRLHRELLSRLHRLESRTRQIGIERPGYVLMSRIQRANQRIDELQSSASRVTTAQIEEGKNRLAKLRERLQRADIRVRLQQGHQQRLVLQAKLDQRIRIVLAKHQRGVSGLEAELRQLNPKAVLERGYSIVQLADGTVVQKPAHAPAGADLRISLAEGQVGAKSTG